MTKNFCDLCGKPALDQMPDMKVAFPDKTWTGSKMTPGSIAYTDGTWTPFVSARMIFEAHDMPRSVRCHLPDLCVECICKLLERMRNQFLEVPKAIQ